MDEIIDVEALFIDELTGQMFYANQKDIESARNQLNDLVALNGHVTIGDYVKALGLCNESDLIVSDVFGVKEGPIEFIMDATTFGIKLSIDKKWNIISPWDS